jgi:uncharacterized protein (TIGR02611 family)
MTSQARAAHPDGSIETAIRADIVDAERSDRPIRRALRRMRAWVSTHRRLNTAYRTLVGILGGSLAILGLLLVPLPGPGWLVVFLGLAVLGTEFHWAGRIASWLKRVLDRFWAWWRARRARKAAAKVEAGETT